MGLADQLRLMVLTDAGLLKGRDPVEACRRAVAGGATIVEVRHKGAPARELAALARALVGALSVPVLVNDRVDVALATGAAGAHLGQDDPPLDAVRPHVPPGFLLGASVGSPAEADRVRSEEHTSELQSQSNLVCRLLLEKKNKRLHHLAP